MTRRLALALLFGKPRAAKEPPTESDRINAFAVAFNQYTDSLSRGMIDVRAWRKVLELWERL